MDIRQLTGDGFIDRKKIDRLNRNTDSASSAPKESDSSGTATDLLDLSGIDASELNVVNQAFANLSQQSLDRVKKLRQQIQNGEYNVQEALDKAAGKILADVKSVQTVSISRLKEVAASKASLEKLSDEVLNVISRKILKDLANL